MSSAASESFRDLLLRHRASTGLSQRQLADRLGINRRSVQEWEIGATYPSAARLEALLRVLLEARGLTAGQETAEAQALWAAAAREAPRTHAPFDRGWFAQLLAERAAPAAAPDREGARATRPAEAVASVGPRGPAERRQDWGEAPDTSGFVGRSDELLTLGSWVLDERCRLVLVLGMGGIGKTSLAARLAQEVAPAFERVYWRSLRDAPPPSDWLAGAIGFLSDQRVLPPAAESERLTTLLRLLRERRCLLVLDNFETLFEPGQSQGRYREGVAGYGRLLRAFGEASHQSCLVLTSREAPPELAFLEGDAVHTFQLGGLGVDEAQALLAPKQLAGAPEAWTELIGRFGGNGLALRMVGERIRELFGGDIGAFLGEAAGASTIFGGIRRLLNEQVERSSVPEQQILRALAVAREPMRLKGLVPALGPRIGHAAMLEAIESLRRRSLIERAEMPGVAAFTLQSVVLEYVTDRLVADVADEIERAEPELLIEQALIQAQAKDYVRQAQERVIGLPILQRLDDRYGARGIETRLFALLDGWRDRPSEEQGSGPGNVVNLLRLLRGDLRGLNLSRLTLRQAYLVEVEAQDATLAGARLVETVLAEAFDFPGSVAVSADGALLAAGTQTGQVWLWRVADRTPLLAVQGHTGAVWGVALGAAGHLLASGAADARVRLWDTRTGRPVATFEGHTGVVRSVALSADGHLLASGGTDGTVRLWETDTGRPLATLQGHTGGIWRLTLAANGCLLASVGTDGMVQLWETGTARSAATLHGLVARVRSLALCADGHLLASGDTDGRVQLWETRTGQPTATLQAHADEVWGVALSADGRLLVSGGADGARLWETSAGQPVATCLAGVVWGVALSADGQLLASGSTDGTVRLWETGTGQPAATLQGQTGAIRGVALSADGRLVASGGEDTTVRLWDVGTGQPVATLQGHTSGVLAVSVSADGRLLASSAGDGTVRLWEVSTGRPVATLRGHAGGVRGVALSADGHLVASGDTDGTVRLWEVGTGRPVATLRGHAGEVRGVALSADGHLLASGGADTTVRLWETSTGHAVATLQGHAGEVWGLALAADGRLLASGSADGTVQLWEVSTGRLVATLQNLTSGVLGVALSAGSDILLAIGGADGAVRLWKPNSGQPVVTLRGHTGGVPGVALSADGRLLATGSYDGTAKVWAPSTGTCLHTLRAERRYERLDITGLAGITDVQRERLLALGAVEQRGPA